MAQPLLNGQVIDPLESEVSRLEEENSQLSTRVRELEMELSRTKRENQRAIAELRRMTQPFLNALLAIHGQMEAIGGEVASDQVPQRKTQVWEAWKSKLGGLQAKFIDAMLLHGEMTQTQLRVVAQCASGSVTNTLVALNKLGLIKKNAGKYSLKEI